MVKFLSFINKLFLLPFLIMMLLIVSSIILLEFKFNLINLFYLFLFISTALFIYIFCRVLIYFKKNDHKDLLLKNTNLILILFLVIIALSAFLESTNAGNINLIWVITCITSAIYFFLLLNSPSAKEKGTDSYLQVYSKLFLGLIILLGCIIRLWHIDNLGFWSDEGISVLMAQSFLTNDWMTFPSGVFYDRAAPYHYYIGLIYALFHKFVEPEIILRIANIPFYVFNCIIIYYLSNKILSRSTSLIPVLLFSTSWISISMFREVRFYELSLTLFLSVVYVFLKYFNYINFEAIFKKDAFKKSFLGISTLLLLLYIGYLIHPLIIIFLYILVVFYFVLYIKTKKIDFLIFSLLTFSTIVLGIYLFVKSTFPFVTNFNIQYVLKLPTPEWAVLDQSNSIFSVMNQLILSGHWFIYIIIIVLPSVFFLERNYKKLFLYSSVSITYLFLSFQEYDINSIRYFYILIPFILISFTSAIFDISKFTGKIIFPIAFLILVPFFISGFTEMNSTQTFNSNNVMKSFDYQSAFKFLEQQNTCLIYTDTQLSIPYYLFFNRNPDGIIYDSQVLSQNQDKDLYLDVELFDYSHLSKSSCEKYFALIYMGTQISNSSWSQLNSLGTLVYKDKALLIYKIE